MYKRIAIALACALGWSVAAAQDAGSALEQELAAAIQEANETLVPGPAEVPLEGQAVLKLGERYLWIPNPAASRYMRALGNTVDERFLGLVMPFGDGGDWMVSVEYEAAGYIKDDDARDWDAGALLASLKEGTEAANALRRERGIPELELLGWVEQPAYDAATHRLVWSISARERGVAEDAPVINYNTYALGRQGYFTLNLITGLDRIEQDKPVAAELLTSLEFLPGKRYADFDPSSDRVAEYGLAALVTGVAAKKLGLFALIGAFVMKFFKVFAVAGVAIAAAVVKLFNRKRG